MKSSYEVLITAIEEEWNKVKTLNGWQQKLTTVCKEHGWTREEFNEEVYQSSDAPVIHLHPTVAYDHAK